MFLRKSCTFIRNVISGGNDVSYQTCRFECDSSADLPAQSQTDYMIDIGSTAHDIYNDAEYMMDSSGTWRLQQAGTAAYTKAETDALIADSVLDWFRVGTALERGDDVDDLTDIGIYNVLSNDDAGYISGLPAPYGGRLEVFATISNTSYVRQLYICNDDQSLIYTRRKLSVDWSDWILLTPLNVCFSTGSQITATIDNRFNLNSLQKIGRYFYGGSAAPYLDNAPSDMSTAWGGEIIVDRIQLSNRYRQTIILNANAHAGKRWERIAYSGTAPNLSWSSWYRFDGTAV